MGLRAIALQRLKSRLGPRLRASREARPEEKWLLIHQALLAVDCDYMLQRTWTRAGMPKCMRHPGATHESDATRSATDRV